jgi:hypothetical protein
MEIHLMDTCRIPDDSIQISRFGMDRCLSRHGVGNLRDLLPKEGKVPAKAFKHDDPGFLHMDVKDLPQMEDETKRRHRFVAIDRTSLHWNSRKDDDDRTTVVLKRWTD